MHEKQPADDYRDYPILQELLTDHSRYTSLREKCLRTCQQLDEIVRTGSAEERGSAQRTLNAYGHALGFLDEVILARDRVLEQHASGGIR
jgi:hypothetical protein